jgi:ribosome-associated protein
MPRIQVTRSISIDEAELIESATRASGAGGQHVNTTDSAVVLRFDVAASPSLPEAVKARLTQLGGARMTGEGVLILRSEGSRSQFENRRDARERLIALIAEATIVPKKRRPTKPSKAAKAKRVDSKKARSTVKSARGRVKLD